MNDQAELPFRVKQDTEATKAEVNTLVEILGLNPTEWIPASQLTLCSDRKLRALANASNGEIVSSNEGYKLLRHCTPEEVTHAAGRLRSQGEAMIARATKILALYHRYGKI